MGVPHTLHARKDQLQTLRRVIYHSSSNQSSEFSMTFVERILCEASDEGSNHTASQEVFSERK